MTRLFYAHEISQPEDVIPYLAKGERHWRKGYSAYELANSWVSADGIPGTVQTVLDTCPEYQGAVLIEGLFERDVDLRTPGRKSQTDLLALCKLSDGPAVIAVEGKVEEPFGPFVQDWNNRTPGKVRRLEALCASLGLPVTEVGGLRYQLLHRTASAIYEAQRYHADRALMLVHSFSELNTSFKDFQVFSEAMGMRVTAVNQVSEDRLCEGVRIRLGWVKDQATPN